MAYSYSRNVIPLGDQTGRKQSIVEIPAEAASDKPGILSLVAVADGGVRTAYYYWTDSNGVLRQHTSIPTNQDSDGTAVVASGAATTALSNLASVAINTSLISDTANTDDLGSDPLSWRTVYWTTSLKKIGTSFDVTLAATEPAAASYTYTFPDAAADANVMLDTGAANVIAYTKGTSTIAMAANSDIDLATGVTMNIDQNLTVNTEAVTLNQSLSTTDDVTFDALTTTSTAAGTLTIAAASITDSSGAISFGNENLTTTGTINLASDNVNLTLGASGSTDSRIFFDGAGNLMFYDSNMAASRSLTELYTGTTLNPSVSGNLTITDGNFTWTNTSNSETAVFTLAATTVDGIQIASSNTTADAVQITADATTSGAALKINTVDATMGGGGGSYLICYDGAANDFAIGRYGATTIAGNAAGTAALTLTAGDIKVTSGYIDLDSAAGNGGHNINSDDDGSSATPLITVTNSQALFDMPLLVLDYNATGAYNAMTITHDSTGVGLVVTGTAVTGSQLKVVGPASQTASSLIVDGTTGSWIGAATTGMLHLSSDGALVADASLLRISSTGDISAANDGACLEVIETGAAQATTYAVRIASTSNEALHVDTGLSLFDERVTITLSDNTGPALAITNPDTTGNTNAVTIAPSGSGAGLYINPQEADTQAIKVVAVASSTVSQVALDLATNNWIGAANVGAIHSSVDAALADVAAAQIYLGASDAIDDSRGHCLRIVDSSNVDGTMGYPVYIASNDATMGGLYISTNAAGAALTVVGGTASFAGKVTLSGGVVIPCNDADVTNPPTNAECIATFGAAATVGAGFIAIVDDANGHANTYIVYSDGTKYWQVTGTACA